MDSIDLWKCSTDYTVFHAALLIVGRNPDDYDAVAHNPNLVLNPPPGYLAVLTALTNAILNSKLETGLRSDVIDDFGHPIGLNIYRTTISSEDLHEFCQARGFEGSFCMPRNQSAAALSISQSPFYSVKMAAANRVLQALISDPSLTKGRSPKATIKIWLRTHAESCGLLNKHGKPNETAIEEIAKVVNWKPEGGANRTRSSEVVPSPQDLDQFFLPQEPLDEMGRKPDDRFYGVPF